MATNPRPRCGGLLELMLKLMRIERAKAKLDDNKPMKGDKNDCKKVKDQEVHTIPGTQ